MARGGYFTLSCWLLLNQSINASRGWANARRKPQPQRAAHCVTLFVPALQQIDNTAGCANDVVRSHHARFAYLRKARNESLTRCMLAERITKTSPSRQINQFTCARQHLSLGGGRPTILLPVDLQARICTQYTTCPAFMLSSQLMLQANTLACWQDTYN